MTFITGKVDRAEHGDGQSTVFIEGVGAAGGDGSSSSGSSVQLSGSLVLDATGHSRRLVEFDKKFDPGYQGAYGIVAGGCGCCVRFGCSGCRRFGEDVSSCLRRREVVQEGGCCLVPLDLCVSQGCNPV